MANHELRLEEVGGNHLARARLYRDNEPHRTVITFGWPTGTYLQLSVEQREDEQFRAAAVAEASRRFVIEASMTEDNDLGSQLYEVHLDSAQSWLDSGQALPDMQVGDVLCSWLA
jgi:hypothetical protein